MPADIPKSVVRSRMASAIDMISRNLMRTISALLVAATMSTSTGCRNSSSHGETLPTPRTAGAHHLSTDFHRGVNHAHTHRGGLGYGSATSAAELDSLRAIGVNWIAITPFGYQQAAGADALSGFGTASEQRRDPSLTDEHLAGEIRTAHRLGIKVTLKPHIWSHDFWDGSAWHGTIDQSTPQAHARWWQSYRAFALHYARLAESAGADLYCIGTELVAMTTRYPEEWRALIADIRKEYHGPLSYAAHWDREVEEIAFWDALDFIGVTAYFPLRLPDSATIDDLVAAWGPYRQRLQNLAARYDRPVLFLEAGYRPVAGTYREPWSYSGGTPDPTAQARAYEAMFAAMYDAEWWHGIYFWKTFTGGVRDLGDDRSFSFRQLPAEAVVRRWFTGR